MRALSQQMNEFTDFDSQEDVPDQMRESKSSQKRSKFRRNVEVHKFRLKMCGAAKYKPNRSKSTSRKFDTCISSVHGSSRAAAEQQQSSSRAAAEQQQSSSQRVGATPNNFFSFFFLFSFSRGSKSDFCWSQFRYDFSYHFFQKKKRSRFARVRL